MISRVGIAFTAAILVGGAVPDAARASAPLSSRSAEAKAVFFEPGLASAGFFPEATPDSLGVDQATLRTLMERPEAQNSDALIVLKDGRVLAERYYGSSPRPIPLASVTKAVVSIAIMALLADGRIASLDAPMSTWFPDWKHGPKSGVTLRHVLTHRSGLNCARGIAEGDRILSQQYDTVAFAASQPLQDKPGQRYCYNNAAIQLLARVIEEASGQPADEYMDRKIFAPLGITKLRWDLDRSGAPLVYGGLALTARDLAKVGQLMLQEGRWQERQLIPAEIVRRFTTSTSDPELGLIWHIAQTSADPRASPSGYYHDGSGGQYLVVYPHWGFVGVRLHDMARGDDGHVGFGRFFSLLREMGRGTSPGAAQIE